MDALISIRWETLFFYQAEILLASNALMVAAAALAIQRFRATVRRNEKFWGSPVGAQIAAGTDESDTVLLAFLEHRLGLLHDRIDQIARKEVATRSVCTPTSDNVAQSMPFEYAVRMAQHGAGIDELIRACGLNRAEARLIQRVHGPAGHDRDAASDDNVTRH